LRCQRSRVNFHNEMKIYFLQHGKRGPIKIGRAMDPKKRVAEVRGACPYDLRLLAVVDGSASIERGLHQKFSKLWIRGEWYRPGRELVALIAKLPNVVLPEAPPEGSRIRPGRELGRRTEFELGRAKDYMREGLKLSQAASKAGVSRQRLHYHVKKDKALMAMLVKRKNQGK